MFVSMDFTFSFWKPVVAAGIAILSFCLLRRWGSGKRRTAPEVPGGWPIIGHLLMLGGSKPPHRALGDMADKCGPIFTIRFGLLTTVVVNNSTLAKECLGLNEAALFDRPQVLASKSLMYNYALFAFSNNFMYWREVRKIATSEFFSNRRLNLLKHVKALEMDIWIAELHDTWSAEKVKDSSSTVMVELKEWFAKLTFNLILKILVGKRYFGSRREGNEEEARKFSKAQESFFHYMGMFIISDAIPFLAVFDFGGHQKAMKKVAEEMDCVLEGWLEEHKRRRDSGLSEAEENFMDAFISGLDGKDLHGYDADTITKATILGLIAGASDTTAVTLTWAISLLLNNPQTLHKLQTELDEVIGRDRAVNESDLSNLVYLQGVVKETLRLYPAGPLAGARVFSEDCVIGGYHVRKGTRLIPNVWKIQTDPEVWSEPMEFRPERFVTTHVKTDVRGSHYELIPFGSGKRICPGVNFSMQMVPLALARFLQEFEIQNPWKQAVDMTESSAFTNMKVSPLHVLITPRFSANAWNCGGI